MIHFPSNGIDASASGIVPVGNNVHFLHDLPRTFLIIL
jgi:hypothetical protein